MTKHVSSLETEHQQQETVIENLKKELSQEKTESKQNEEDKIMVIKDLELRIRDLNHHLEQRDINLKEKDMTIESLTKELKETNEKTMKLEEQLDRSQKKVNLLSEVSSRQDSLVSQKSNKIKEMEADFKMCVDKITQKERLEEKMADELDRIRKELSEALDTLETKESLIGFLNKQVAARDTTGKTVNPRPHDQDALMQQQMKVLKQSNAVTARIQQMDLNQGLRLPSCPIPSPPEPTPAPRVVQFQGMLPSVGLTQTTTRTTCHANKTRYQRNPLAGRTTSGTEPNGFVTSKGVK